MDRAPTPAVATMSRGVIFSWPIGLGFLAPLLMVMAIFFFGALFVLLWEILKNGPTGAAALVGTILSNTVFQAVAARSLRISAVVTALTVVIGYGAAFAIWRSPPHTRLFWLGLVLFPLFTSVVVRTYAWTMLMSRNGVINTILTYGGLIDEPLQMLGSEGAVLIGMVQVMLPFAIMPIYTLLLRLDEDLLRASAISGARGWQTLWNVVLPLTSQGTLVATVLVFVISLGFFITPAILGGPRFSMISNLINLEITRYFDLEAAAAMSLLLLIVTLLLLSAVSRIGSIGDHLRGFR